MTRVMKIVGGALLIGLVLSAALVASVVAIAGTLIDINGESLAQLGAGHWLAVVAGTLLVLLIVLVLLPLAVLLPLGLVALLVVGVLAEVAGVAALVFSPLMLLAGVVWLIWRLARRDTPKPRTAADATGTPGATIAG